MGCFSVIGQVNDTIVSTESFGKVPIDNDNKRRTGRYRESEARDWRLISSLRGPALKQLHTISPLTIVCRIINHDEQWIRVSKGGTSSSTDDTGENKSGKVPATTTKKINQ